MPGNPALIKDWTKPMHRFKVSGGSKVGGLLVIFMNLQVIGFLLW
jgi:hypothetical protein